MFKKLVSELRNCIENTESFVLSRLPNQNKIQLWRNQNGHSQKFVIQNFLGTEKVEFLNDDPLEVQDSEFRVQTDSILKQFKFISANDKLPTTHNQQPTTKLQYINLIQNTIDTIKTTDLEKVVISRKKMLEKTANPLELFKNLTQSYPNAFVYLWYENGKCWIGATPETLISVKNNVLKTMALAGTKSIEKEWTQKELDEQQMVTDYIHHQLQPFGQVKQSERQTITYGQIQHLKTEISCKLNASVHINHILEALHPTPAVCGLPKEQALSFIQEYENYDRSFYTGYIGIENPNEKSAEYFVNLRCAQLFKNQTHIYVGGGITANSIPENEWLETELKAKSISKLL